VSVIGLTIRAIFGAVFIYLFVGLLTEWNGFKDRDPIESERYYTLFTLWLLPYVFNFTFQRRWSRWPTVVFVAAGAALGLAGYLLSGDWWSLVLAAGVYAGESRGLCRVGGVLPRRSRDPKPWVRAGRHPLAHRHQARRGDNRIAPTGLRRGPRPPRSVGSEETSADRGGVVARRTFPEGSAGSGHATR
jgi:hypothetical protein